MTDMDPSPLEQLRRRLALAVGENAVFDGWTKAAVDSAAQQLGVDPIQARLAMPKKQADMIDLYIQEVDRALEAWFTPERLAKLKIREKIRSLVWHRLEIMGPAREAIRRGLAILAMPQNLPLALRISWRTADQMWRIAGDTSTDFNHYTKRMTLGAVYGSNSADMARRPKRRVERNRRLPRQAHRQRHAVREAEGGMARLIRPADQPFALLRSSPLSAALRL